MFGNRGYRVVCTIVRRDGVNERVSHHQLREKNKEKIKVKAIIPFGRKYVMGVRL